MGSIFAPKTPTPPPPPPPSTIRDEIGGTEQIPVKNADGSTTYITRRIPLTAEQEAEKAEYERIMSESLSEIEKLTSSDYTPDEGTQNVLNAWEQERNKLIDKNYGDRESFESKNLARRGLSDSSAAESINRQRRLDQQEAEKQLENESTLLGRDIRNQQIQLQQGLYSLAANKENADDLKTFQSAVTGQSSAIASGMQSQASLMDYYNRQQASAKAQNSAMFGTLGAIGGAFVGGPGGAAAGYQMGSSFGSTM